MNNLTLEHKTGFLSTMPFDIYDNNGQLFYSSKFTDHIGNGETLKFNLPAGDYKYNGNFIKLANPVKVVNIPLPPKERHITPKRYEIIFADNPNKCSIYYDEGVIIFDNSFKNKPMYVKYVIYFHELGHHWYQTEEKADLFAAKKLLELGFNPSQIGRAFLDSLSLKSYDRMEKMINKLTNNSA